MDDAGRASGELAFEIQSDDPAPQAPMKHSGLNSGGNPTADGRNCEGGVPALEGMATKYLDFAEAIFGGLDFSFSSTSSSLN